MQIISTEPVDVYDAIDAVTTRWDKTYGRQGISRPTGAVILGQAATGLLTDLSTAEKETSVADRLITGDELTDLPPAVIATLGTGKTAIKFTTYHLIGLHVAAQIGLGSATIADLNKLPGTSAAQVMKILAELPSMADYKAQIEARRKAAAKKAADTAAVSLVFKFAEKFKADHTEEVYAEVMADRSLTWDEVQVIIAQNVQAKDAADKADADKVDA
ncbi:hypothetical protein [Planotetraspora phitsanulokensis]|uniref:Uncharacterized protein n=1 Tax=Planotetraspora phitsanulokensis TaxID=575192 RepID=A0A8J3XKC0_9ACTN|nr:hypothetical protein [Planotetraspora phitsanulokensis]GII42966.1 hypothetical protein Pph01_79690 [Planotetraspora phitsanulokensis]